jgi:hypothetical protein
MLSTVNFMQRPATKSVTQNLFFHNTGIWRLVFPGKSIIIIIIITISSSSSSSSTVAIMHLYAYTSHA